MDMDLPRLNKKDYLEKGYDFWKKYREMLYQVLKEQEQEEKLAKTPQNIVKLAQEIGVKATARYFSITPSMVRYYRNNHPDSSPNLEE